MKGKEMSFTEEQCAAAYAEILKTTFNKASWEDLPPFRREIYLTFANALSAKREGTPIDTENVRVGDLVTGTIARQCSEGSKGGVVKGVAYHSALDGLCVTGWHIDTLDNLRLIHRPTPQLPTERPAVILATEVRGEIGEWWLTLTPNGEWGVTGAPINGFYAVAPKHITAWKPADFVVRDGDE